MVSFNVVYNDQRLWMETSQMQIVSAYLIIILLTKPFMQA